MITQMDKFLAAGSWSSLGATCIRDDVEPALSRRRKRVFADASVLAKFRNEDFIQPYIGQFSDVWQKECRSCVVEVDMPGMKRGRPFSRVKLRRRQEGVRVYARDAKKHQGFGGSQVKKQKGRKFSPNTSKKDVRLTPLQETMMVEAFSIIESESEPYFCSLEEVHERWLRSPVWKEFGFQPSRMSEALHYLKLPDEMLPFLLLTFSRVYLQQRSRKDPRFSVLGVGVLNVVEKSVASTPIGVNFHKRLISTIARSTTLWPSHLPLPQDYVQLLNSIHFFSPDDVILFTDEFRKRAVSGFETQLRKREYSNRMEAASVAFLAYLIGGMEPGSSGSPVTVKALHFADEMFPCGLFDSIMSTFSPEVNLMRLGELSIWNALREEDKNEDLQWQEAQEVCGGALKIRRHNTFRPIFKRVDGGDARPGFAMSEAGLADRLFPNQKESAILVEFRRVLGKAMRDDGSLKVTEAMVESDYSEGQDSADSEQESDRHLELGAAVAKQDSDALDDASPLRNGALSHVGREVEAICENTESSIPIQFEGRLNGGMSSAGEEGLANRKSQLELGDSQTSLPEESGDALRGGEVKTEFSSGGREGLGRVAMEGRVEHDGTACRGSHGDMNGDNQVPVRGGMREAEATNAPSESCFSPWPSHAETVTKAIEYDEDVPEMSIASDVVESEIEKFEQQTKVRSEDHSSGSAPGIPTPQLSEDVKETVAAAVSTAVDQTSLTEAYDVSYASQMWMHAEHAYLRLRQCVGRPYEPWQRAMAYTASYSGIQERVVHFLMASEDDHFLIERGVIIKVMAEWHLVREDLYSRFETMCSERGFSLPEAEVTKLTITACDGLPPVEFLPSILSNLRKDLLAVQHIEDFFSKSLTVNTPSFLPPLNARPAIAAEETAQPIPVQKERLNVAGSPTGQPIQIVDGEYSDADKSVAADKQSEGSNTAVLAEPSRATPFARASNSKAGKVACPKCGQRRWSGLDSSWYKKHMADCTGNAKPSNGYEHVARPDSNGGNVVVGAYATPARSEGSGNQGEDDAFEVRVLQPAKFGGETSTSNLVTRSKESHRRKWKVSRSAASASGRDLERAEALRMSSSKASGEGVRRPEWHKDEKSHFYYVVDTNVLMDPEEREHLAYIAAGRESCATLVVPCVVGRELERISKNQKSKEKKEFASAASRWYNVLLKKKTKWLHAANKDEMILPFPSTACVNSDDEILAVLAYFNKQHPMRTFLLTHDRAMQNKAVYNCKLAWLPPLVIQDDGSPPPRYLKALELSRQANS